MIFSTRFDVGWHFSERTMEISNCSRNCSKEQLYIHPDGCAVMGLDTSVMSVMQKYMILPRVATGLTLRTTRARSQHQTRAHRRPTTLTTHIKTTIRGQTKTHLDTVNQANPTENRQQGVSGDRREQKRREGREERCEETKEEKKERREESIDDEMR